MQKLTLKLSVTENESELINKACKKLGLPKEKIKYFKVVKKSLDARDKRDVFYSCVVELSTSSFTPEIKTYNKIKGEVSVLVVGAGPAGLFCALDLLRYGFKVTLIERGDSVERRQNAVKNFVSTKVLNEDSNIQFGEGGAGAFSDGKLNTSLSGELVKEVINDFITFGAPKEIGYLNKPHIGSDNLPTVVKNIRNEIIRLGGKVLFNTKLTDIKIENGKVTKVYYGNTIDSFDNVVLAVGHSARDVYEMVSRRNVFMESKDFAVGFRIEHLASDINLAQYGEKFSGIKGMPTADYKLVSHYQDKGIFTFCMCPGGYVMPSSSENGGLVVNGMSNFKRDGVNSNSAVVVQVGKNDFGSELFSGMNFQRKIERNAFTLGGGDYTAPVQLVADFLKDKPSTNLEKVTPTYPIGYKLTSLSSLLPSSLVTALKSGIVDMGKKLKGFDGNGGVLTAVESRTSSPVRITRNENFESVSVSNLYPCGEGCGYAGGISSAGADGKRVAKKLYEKYSG